MVYETRTLKVRSNPKKKDLFHPRVVSPHPLSSVSALPISRAVWKQQKDLRKCRSFTIIMFNVFRCYLIRGGSSLGLRVFRPSSFSPHTWYFKFGIFYPPQTLFRSYKASTVTPLLSLMFYLPVCGYYWRSTSDNHASSWRILCAPLTWTPELISRWPASRCMHILMRAVCATGVLWDCAISLS